MEGIRVCRATCGDDQGFDISGQRSGIGAQEVKVNCCVESEMLCSLSTGLWMEPELSQNHAYVIGALSGKAEAYHMKDITLTIMYRPLVRRNSVLTQGSSHAADSHRLVKLSAMRDVISVCFIYIPR